LTFWRYTNQIIIIIIIKGGSGYRVVSGDGLCDVVNDADALILHAICPRDHQRVGVAPDHLREVMIPARPRYRKYT